MFFIFQWWVGSLSGLGFYFWSSSDLPWTLCFIQFFYFSRGQGDLCAPQGCYIYWVEHIKAALHSICCFGGMAEDWVLFFGGGWGAGNFGLPTVKIIYTYIYIYCVCENNTYGKHDCPLIFPRLPASPPANPIQWFSHLQGSNPALFYFTGSHHGSVCNTCGHKLLVREHRGVFLVSSTYMIVFTETIFGPHSEVKTLILDLKIFEQDQICIWYMVICFSY